MSERKYFNINEDNNGASTPSATLYRVGVTTFSHAAKLLGAGKPEPVSSYARLMRRA